MSHEPSESFCTHSSNCSCFAQLEGEIAEARKEIFKLKHPEYDLTNRDIETLEITKDLFNESENQMVKAVLIAGRAEKYESRVKALEGALERCKKELQHLGYFDSVESQWLQEYGSTAGKEEK